MHHESFPSSPPEGETRPADPKRERPELRVLRPYSDAAKEWADRTAENLRGYARENELIMNLEGVLRGLRNDAEHERDKAAEERRRSSEARAKGRPSSAAAHEQRAVSHDEDAELHDDKANAVEAVLAIEEARWQKLVHGSEPPEATE